MSDQKTLLPFLSPTTIYISGPTQSGKSMLARKLIENASTMFTEPPEKILYAYSEYQKMFNEMQNIPNLTFYEGLPNTDVIEEFTLNQNHSLIFLDDLISRFVQDLEQLHLFSVTSHHRGASVVLISQSLYPPGKYSKSISLNCANFILFRNPRDMRQLSTFASQILPGRTKYFNDSFKKATEGKNFGHLLVDLSNQRTDCEKYMLRSGIFPDDTCVIYRPI